MPDDPYSLADLARLADVTPRTVRYYVAQGLLPSPEAAGPATRYGEGHLARLRLIKRLQRDHLPLAEIRSRLERMGDDEVDAGHGAARRRARAADVRRRTLAYVRGLMTKAGVAPRFYDQPPALASGRRRTSARRPDEYPLRDAPAMPRHRARPVASPPASCRRSRRAPVPSRSSPRPSTGAPGNASSITPDIEIHVRRPLDRRSNKLVERLARIARDLFDDEP